MITLIHYPKCTTCQKAKKWLDANHVDYIERDIKLNAPTLQEIQDFHKKSGLPINKLFNTSGMAYRSLNLKDKISKMSIEECYSLLSSDGMLVKRPLLVMDNEVLVGFKEAEWEKHVMG